MERRDFHTQYDPAVYMNHEKVFDTHDNVDRVSYVDNTAMVKRFILEGRSLSGARAAALRSGMYSGDLKEMENDKCPPIPVYQMDATVADKMIASAKSYLSETPENAKTGDAKSNDATIVDSNSGVAEPNERGIN